MTPLIAFEWPRDAVTILVILLGALVLRLVLQRAISSAVRASVSAAERHAERRSRDEAAAGTRLPSPDARNTARVRTVGSVLTNATDIVLVVVTVLTILHVLGVPLQPILTASGIGGVALAFGAQSLVKDYISGMLMIFEDQFGVGDLIDTGEVVGTVEEVGLRVTRLRDANGQIWYVRNGEIVRVGNQSQGWSTGIVDVPIHMTEDAGRAIEVLRGVAQDVFTDEKWEEILLEEPNVAGVDKVAQGQTTIRIFAKTRPNEQWGVQRDILARSVAALQKAGIRGPQVLPTYPQAPQP